MKIYTEMIDQKKFPGKFWKYATSQVFVHNKVRYNNLFIGAWLFEACKQCTVTQQTLVQKHNKLWYRNTTNTGTGSVQEKGFGQSHQLFSMDSANVKGVNWGFQSFLSHKINFVTLFSSITTKKKIFFFEKPRNIMFFMCFGPRR